MSFQENRLTYIKYPAGKIIVQELFTLGNSGETQR